MHQLPSLTGVSLHNFWSINTHKDIRDDEMSATENYPTTQSTQLWCKALWYQGWDFSVWWFCAHKGKHIHKYLRETLEAIIIFILKSDIKYNHIYSCLFGEYFQNIEQCCHFPVKQWQSISAFPFKIFSVFYGLYTQNRQKLYRNAEPKMWYGKSWQKSFTENDF